MIQKLRLISLLLILIGAAATAEPIRLDMKSSARLLSGTIRLGDVARINTPDAAKAEQLADISLGAAPLAGNARNVTRRTVLIHLARQGINPDTIKWSGAQFCTVSTRSLSVKGKDIVQKARQYLLSLPVFQRKGVSIKVDRVPHDKTFPAHGGPIRLSISAAAVKRPWGNIRAYVSIRREGQTLATVPLLFHVTCKTKILVAAGTIRRGRRISAEDLREQEVILGRGSAALPYVIDRRDVLNKQAVRSIAAGTPLTADMITDPLVVRRGDDVSISLRSKGLEIVTKGVALGNGRLGENVMVKVLLSGKETPCTVAGQGQVEIKL